MHVCARARASVRLPLPIAKRQTNTAPRPGLLTRAARVLRSRGARLVCSVVGVPRDHEPRSRPATWWWAPAAARRGSQPAAAEHVRRAREPPPRPVHIHDVPKKKTQPATGPTRHGPCMTMTICTRQTSLQKGIPLPRPSRTHARTHAPIPPMCRSIRGARAGPRRPTTWRMDLSRDMAGRPPADDGRGYRRPACTFGRRDDCSDQPPLAHRRSEL